MKRASWNQASWSEHVAEMRKKAQKRREELKTSCCCFNAQTKGERVNTDLLSHDTEVTQTPFSSETFMKICSLSDLKESRDVKHTQRKMASGWRHGETFALSSWRSHFYQTIRAHGQKNYSVTETKLNFSKWSQTVCGRNRKLKVPSLKHHDANI